MMNKKLKKALKYSILYPAYLIKRLYIRYLRKNDPIKLMKMTYRNNMGIPLNLDNPQTLDEKINFMSFYTDTSLWSELADKVKVRDYIIKNGFPEILNELYITATADIMIMATINPNRPIIDLLKAWFTCSAESLRSL